MVYWGCSTCCNRLMWCVCGASAAAAFVLLCVGSSQMWHCDHQIITTGSSSSSHTAASSSTHKADVSACRIQAGILMAMCPLLLLAGVLPSLLFFQSCLATQPPPLDADCEVGVPASSVTAMVWTPNGPAVSHYDAQGKLLHGPDCCRHNAPSPKSPHRGPKMSPGRLWASAELQADTSSPTISAAAAAGAAAAGAYYTRDSYATSPVVTSASQELGTSENRVSAAAAVMRSCEYPRRSHQRPEGLVVDTSAALRSSGQYSFGSSRPQYSPAGRQYSPSAQQAVQHTGQYSSDGQAIATAGDVYMCLSPLTQGASQLSSK